MGAWGAGNFENDSAADWAGDLVERGSPDLVRVALQAAVDGAGQDDLDADVGTEALAAAEVVAAAAGRGGAPNAYNEDVLKWAADHPELGDADTRELALQAVEAVRSDASELAELWSEASEGETADPKWVAVLEDLATRLS